MSEPAIAAPSDAASANETVADGGLPLSLRGDPSFWGMTATQFLGAFNDNLFKQVVLLLTIDEAARRGQPDRQWLALALFALPFVLFSGFAGFLADRFSKRQIIVLCKVAEVMIVILATLALRQESLMAALAVLFLLGAQSAFFGPAKYGVLPEIIRERNLPAANGIFLMTTFAAIILGQAAAGYMKQAWMPGRILLVGLIYLLIAGAGLATSLLVRRTPAANRRLAFSSKSLLIRKEMLQLLRCDKALLIALSMSSAFWMVAGIIQPAVNAYGKKQLAFDDARTSLILTFLTAGIAAGCILGGLLSGRRVNFRLVTLGCWGMVVGLVLFALWGAMPGMAVETSAGGARLLLSLMGLAAGVFAVPLQVFLQSRPPAEMKGQMIGAMNLANWIAIVLSAGIYGALNVLITGLLRAPVSWVFGATALLLLPVALFGKPRPEERR